MTKYLVSPIKLKEGMIVELENGKRIEIGHILNAENSKEFRFYLSKDAKYRWDSNFLRDTCKPHNEHSEFDIIKVYKQNLETLSYDLVWQRLKYWLVSDIGKMTLKDSLDIEGNYRKRYDDFSERKLERGFESLFIPTDAKPDFE